MKLYELFKKKVFHIDLGLDRVKRVLNELGNPHNSFNSVLISGTNGKGSTSAFLESLLRHTGFKVGLFTSPHLVDERERWQINRKYIPEYKLNRYIEFLRPLIDKHSLTYFEASTVLAFLYFSEEKVDFAVLEVGLGGRYDATNVVYPELSIITNVSFDHTHILGNTLEKIAYEKLGIARKDRALVLGANQHQLLEQAKKLGIKEIFYPPDYYQYETYFESMRQKVNYFFKDISFKDLETKLLGNRQGNNLATALTGYILLMERLGKTIDTDTVYRAVLNTRWKGRMELLSKNPIVILDGAHNEDALKKTYLEINEIFKGKNIKTILSFMRDKNFQRILKIANDFSEEVIFVEMSFDRGMKTNQLKKQYPDLKFLKSINEIKEFIQGENDKNTIFLITGSLYFIGEILAKEGVV